MPAPFADSTKVLVKEFNELNRGNIHINVTRGPRETESVSDLGISSLLLGKSTFDVILMDVTWLPKYAAAGWLTPIDYWFSKEDKSELVEGAATGNDYEGNLYRWPLVADIGLLYWRTDLMNNPPTTPDELIRISKELQENGKIKYGYVWQGRQYEGLSCVFLEVLNGFGGKWIEGTEIGLNTPQSKEASEWLLQLIKEGISPKAVTNFSEPEALQSFKDGDAAFMRNWPYAWTELNSSSSRVQGKVGVTTMVAKDGYQPTSTLGSWGFSITSDSTHPDEDAKAIKFLTSPSSQKYLFKSYGYTPTSNEIFNNKELNKSFPILKSLRAALSVTKARPKTPLYAQISDVLQRELSSILTEQKGIEESLSDAEDNTQKILLSAGKI